MDEKNELLIKEAEEEFVPKKKFNLNTTKRKFHAPITLLDKVRAKRRAYKTWKKYRTTHNYNIYAKARNQVKWEVKKAKEFKEIQVAKDAMANPKGIFKYASSKIKKCRMES